MSATEVGPITDAMVACLLRAAREYRNRLKSEADRKDMQARCGDVLAAADASVLRAEAACVDKAVATLWRVHAMRHR